MPKPTLGIDLDKAVQDAAGHAIRRNFAQYLFAPLTTIPADYLRYAAGDALVTWHLFWELNRLIRDVLRDSSHVRGYVDEPWLRDAIARFGPLTHHVQLKASVVCDVLRKNGIGIDQARQAEKLRDVAAKKSTYEQRLRERKLPHRRHGAGKAMQAAIDRFHAEHPEIAAGTHHTAASGPPQKTTSPTWPPSTRSSATTRPIARWRSWNRPTCRRWIAPAYTRGSIICCGLAARPATASTCKTCPANLACWQETPKPCRSAAASCPATARFSSTGITRQIELVVLAYILKHQFKLGSSLHDLINEGHDIHKLIAAAVLDKNIEDVTKAERTGAKAVSFGRPGGMGVASLQTYAKNSFKQELSVEEVQQRIDAYHRLCPELGPFLQDEVDSGLVIAETLGMTPAEYNEAIGCPAYGQDADVPQELAGRHAAQGPPRTLPCHASPDSPIHPPRSSSSGTRPSSFPLDLKPALAAKLERHEADEELWEAVRDWAGRRSCLHGYRQTACQRPVWQQPQYAVSRPRRRRGDPWHVAAVAGRLQARQCHP